MEKEEFVDPEFDTYIETLIEEEQKNFRPGVESLQMHASKIREQVRGAMHDFLSSFRNGWLLISELLKDQGIEIPPLDEERIALLDNPEQLQNAQSEGKALYELLGYSQETMSSMYQAACHFMDERDFEKGKDAFFFLTTLAQDVAHFWLGLAICYTQLKRHAEALETTLRAIELDPTNADSYLNALHLYKMSSEIDKANELCQKGIDFASAQLDEPWAQELITALEEARRYLNVHNH